MVRIPRFGVEGLLAFAEVVFHQAGNGLAGLVFVPAVKNELQLRALGGGQHRSVYVCNQLTQQFAKQFANIQVQHRELER